MKPAFLFEEMPVCLCMRTPKGTIRVTGKSLRSQHFILTGCVKRGIIINVILKREGMIRMVIKKFLRKYGWLYIPGIVFLAINSRIQTLAPEALGKAIDLLEQAVPDKNLVWRQAGLIILIAVGVFVTRFIWRMMIIRNARSMECFLREELFAKLQSMPISFFSKQRSGDLMAYAINDVGAVRMTFGPVLAQGLNGIITGGLSIWAMTKAVDGRLTFLALIPVPIAIISIILIGNLVQKRFRRVQELFSHLSGFVNESIMGVRVVKTFAREKEWQHEFETTSTEMMQANVKLTDTSALINPITVITFGLSYAVSLIYGGGLVMSGSLALGDLVAFLGYLLLIQNPVVQLGRIVNMLHRGIASYKRLSVIFNEESIPEKEMQEYDRPIDGAIEARNLTFTYPDADKPALENVSFKLPAGGTLGIAGKTGGGKSTLIGLLLKFFDAPRGTLFIDGKDICDIPAKALREAAGYVPQDGFLFSSSIEQDIAFYMPKVGRKEVRQAADLANIDEDISAFPEGYDTQVGERGTRLSGGQKQRISLARALIRDPQILILDDTLSAVDNITAKKIVENSHGLLRDKTSIVISHRLSALRRSDWILFMEDGRVIEAGTHEQLMAKQGAYAETYEKQSKEDEQHEE